MSKWHYRLIKHIYPKGEVHYAVHEYYPATENVGEAWTLSPVAFWGETPDDIHWLIIRVLNDLAKHEIIEVKHDDCKVAQNVGPLLKRIKELEANIEELEKQLEFELSLQDRM